MGMHGERMEKEVMKADYKNWMPKGMVASFIGGAAGSWIAALAANSMMPEGTGRQVVTAVSAASGALFTGVSIWSGMRCIGRLIITERDRCQNRS